MIGKTKITRFAKYADGARTEISIEGTGGAPDASALAKFFAADDPGAVAAGVLDAIEAGRWRSGGATAAMPGGRVFEAGPAACAASAEGDGEAFAAPTGWFEEAALAVLTLSAADDGSTVELDSGWDEEEVARAVAARRARAGAEAVDGEIGGGEPADDGSAAFVESFSAKKGRAARGDGEVVRARGDGPRADVLVGFLERASAEDARRVAEGFRLVAEGAIPSFSFSDGEHEAEATPRVAAVTRLFDGAAYHGPTEWVARAAEAYLWALFAPLVEGAVSIGRVVFRKAPRGGVEA